MAFTNFPNGATSFGIPLMGSGAVSMPAGPNAQVLFVNANTGPGDGSSPESSLTTITSALARLATDGTAYGSTIFVAPGTYDENITVAIDGVSIIGNVMAGYERPDVVPTSGVALTVTTGQGFYCQHMRFAGNTSDTVIHNANGAVYVDCVFDGDAGQAATEGCLRLVPSATDDSYSASENQFIKCLFRGSTSGAGVIFQHALAAGGGEGTTDNQILGCTFVDNGVDLLSATNTNGGGAGIFIKLVVNGCFFLTGGTAYVYGDMDQGAAGDLAANTALISGNWFNDEAIVAAQFDITGQPSVNFVGNYDAAGLIDGSTFNN
jgi:hypothetical protein